MRAVLQVLADLARRCNTGGVTDVTDAQAYFDELIATSDVISLHCPPGPEGRPVLDRETIGELKKGVIVINTARGGLIDDGAMLQALDSGHVKGVGLDVFDNEPPDDWRLALHPQAVSSPHIGGYTPQSIDRAMYSAVQNLLDALGSRPRPASPATCSSRWR